MLDEKLYESGCSPNEKFCQLSSWKVFEIDGIHISISFHPKKCLCTKKFQIQSTVILRENISSFFGTGWQKKIQSLILQMENLQKEFARNRTLKIVREILVLRSGKRANFNLNNIQIEIGPSCIFKNCINSYINIRQVASLQTLLLWAILDFYSSSLLNVISYIFS